MRVRYGGGLTAGSHYFVSNLSGVVYRFYSSAANAIAGTAEGLIDLTGDIGGCRRVQSATPTRTDWTTAES
jgi:hypothetical protein